jgi:hypothetical protein
MLARQALLPLEPLHQPFFLMDFFEIGSLGTICLGLALNCDPPDLCLLCSYVYRCEPPAPGKF